MRYSLSEVLPLLSTLWLCATAVSGASKFERQEIDPGIAIGYGLAIGDVDGDKKPDVLLADKSQIAWYRNGDWKRFVMAENVNPRVGTRFLDNVCIAARDLDGDGKVEVAVGGNWNPGNTKDASKSGSVHYLARPADATGVWKPVRLEHSPTIHRMHFVRGADGGYHLAVLPLHGIGNQGGKGEPVKLLVFAVPKSEGDRANGKWSGAVKVDTGLHATHNFDVVAGGGTGEMLLVGGAEGIVDVSVGEATKVGDKLVSKGAGEVRQGKGMLVSIEPMHGNSVVVYRGEKREREVLDESLSQGHALAIGDVDGDGIAEVVAGWRSKDKDGRVGIRIYRHAGGKWTSELLDDNGMACEDLKLVDLNGDGKLDIVAAGRATKNVVIYWNRIGG